MSSIEDFFESGLSFNSDFDVGLEASTFLRSADPFYLSSSLDAFMYSNYWLSYVSQHFLTAYSFRVVGNHSHAGKLEEAGDYC